MAFDGITTCCITDELNRKLTGGRIYKIIQPEKDALQITVRREKDQYRLLLSASPTLPLIYLTEKNMTAPANAPAFCMLLRKHLQNGRIVGISQPGLERVINIEIEHLDEMGDLCQKILIMELMGKHSNIIFCNDQGKIIDSIKHVSAMISSVREVLPGREYFIPSTSDKKELIACTSYADILCKPVEIYKAIYSAFTGLSPCIAHEICSKADVDSSKPATALSQAEKNSIEKQLSCLADIIKKREFSPTIYYENSIPCEYSAIPLVSSYSSYTSRKYDSISALIYDYYSERELYTRIRQRSTDLRRIVTTIYERNIKKYDLQIRQLKDTEKRDKYRIYGELLNTYGYSAALGDKSLTCDNYYTSEEITIPLDETLTASENAKKYFEKYNKLKRTYEALTELIVSTKAEIDHLDSVLVSLSIAQSEEDLKQIRQELVLSGHIKSNSKGKKERITSKPFHYVSDYGYDFYVGKNNLQNESLTFDFANGGDWWFHSKHAPGSHVILKVKPGEDVPDQAFVDAGKLAAHYSKIANQDKVEVDYTLRKNVKKPNGSAPGFVVYYTNYSLIADSDISKLTLVE